MGWTAGWARFDQRAQTDGRHFRLLKDLAADRTLPRGVRWRLGVAIAYAGQPFNLIPDWIPVIGYADNIAVVCWALRSVIRVAGTAAVEHHWRGTSAALAQLYRMLRVNPQPRASGLAGSSTVSKLSSPQPDDLPSGDRTGRCQMSFADSLGHRPTRGSRARRLETARLP